MAKYDGLGHFLLTSGQRDVRLSFSQMEGILGFALPGSAYRYPAWWANGGHTQAASWMKAGYHVVGLDIPGQTVHFRKEQAVDRFPTAADVHAGHGKTNTSGREKSAPERKSQTQTTLPNSQRLQVCGYDFVFVQDLVPECENGKVKEYYPQNAYNNKHRLPLHVYGAGAFCRFSIQAPPVPGVYLWIVDGQILYIGETANLQQRFNVGYGNISPRNCYIGGQSTNCKMNKVVMEYYKKGKAISLYFHQTENYKQVELLLLSRFNTKYNVKDN